jgi:peptidoglycan/LPS O-acetylase OafA/YrhL|tara:strand:- start:1933 stop:2067 length:135 start_codon:yes stop_codon:yes gene_type:complete
MNNKEKTKRELIANTILAGIAVVLVAAAALYHYFEAILRDYFFR